MADTNLLISPLHWVAIDVARYCNAVLIETSSAHQWDASGIYNDMSFGAKLASVGGVGARFLPPGGLAPRSHLC